LKANHDYTKEKAMSQSSEQKREQNTSRVQVGNLPRQEKDVNEGESAKVKGGGGPSGGVLGDKGADHIGEEIPQ
jgi:hypothetical protein